MTIKLRPFDKTTPPLWEGHLRLEQRCDGVDVVAVYATGLIVPGGVLLSLGSFGLLRHTGISKALGFHLDRASRIRIYGEPDYPARIAELEAEVARLTGSEAPPGKGAWRATEEDQKKDGYCLYWNHDVCAWCGKQWRRVKVGTWVREQPPPPPGGGAWDAYMTPVRPRPMMPNPDTEPKR